MTGAATKTKQQILTFSKELHSSRDMTCRKVCVFMICTKGSSSGVDTTMKSGRIDLRSRHESIDETGMAVCQHTEAWDNGLRSIFTIKHAKSISRFPIVHVQQPVFILFGVHRVVSTSLS